MTNSKEDIKIKTPYGNKNWSPEGIKMDKKQALKLINTAFDRLECLNNITWTTYRDNLFDLHKKEEKQHDNLRPSGTSRGLTITESAKLFTVCWIAEYLLSQKAIDAKDYINVRASAFYAYSVAMTYKTEILKAWEGLSLEDIASLDYAENDAVIY